ncbi:TonB-dependent siderophore receptor [Acinetobacter sp. B5B]|uniref:TonB-dependent receptor n=1 Tax=Acinetobacter baretiae TaxID=2605383 RepID=UPI0018C30CDB|nr:TonB-dependent siderophore receptor [Acinetobacter baretiae]MBF7683280.1 TonB-dependent siderophore receptor [Acinetobacter baretiae]
MSFIKAHKKLVSSTIASSLSLVAGVTFAQEATTLGTIDAHAALEKVDTASYTTTQSANHKYVAPLINTPKSIDVISQKLLQDTSANSLTQALQNTPGVTLAAGEGGTPFTDIPYIRGYSAQSSIYVDGVKNATSQNRDMFDIEQVEITKGSSSAISGGGGAGGSINLITKQAHAGDSYEGTIAGGTANYKHISLDANKDFGDGMAGRVIIMGHQNDKAGEKNGAEYNRVGIAPSLTFGLGTPTRGTLSYYYLQSDDLPDAGIPFPTTGGAPYSVAKGTYYGWRNRDFDRRQNQVGTLKLEHDFNDTLNISNTLTYNRSTTNYIATNPDDSSGNIAKYGTIFRRAVSRISNTNAYNDQMALSGQFNTGSIKHNFSTGADWSYQSTDMGIYSFNGFNSTTGLDIQDQSHNANGNGESCQNLSYGYCTTLYSPTPYDTYSDTATAVKNYSTTRSRTVGLYALDSIEFSPQWLLNLGLRWDKFNTDVKYNYALKLRGTQYSAGQRYRSDTDFFSYQAGLIYKPTENGSIYTSFATSANPVGVDQGDGSDSITNNSQANSLKPEEARTYEIGTKWNILNNHANVTAAVFRTEKQNTRIQIDTSGYANIGKSRVNGFELGLTGDLTDRWNIATGYSYLNSKLTKASPFDARSLAGQGQALPFVSKNSATLWTTYKITPKFIVGAGTQYNDKSVVSYLANNNAPKYVPAYTVYNAMLKYKVTNNINVQLNINNLTDKLYFTNAHYHYAMQADGRNAVLAINFKY